MRTGPKPLMFQLSMASLASAGMAGGTVYSDEMLQDFFKGIKKYQSYGDKLEKACLPEVWNKVEAKLLYCAAKSPKKYAFPILLVPSMINRANILDLHARQSLLRWLSTQGFDVYLLDWGNSSIDPGQRNFDHILKERLFPALQSINTPVCIMGYCMGGLITVAFANLYPEHVRAAMFMAMPWNFHDKIGALKARVALAKPLIQPYIKQHGHLPESWMQAIFATLDPESAIKKFASFSRMKEGEAAAEIFVAVEDWLNNGLDLPGAVAETCIKEWYQENLPMLGAWKVCGQTVKAQDIRCPTCVVAAKEDKIVPLDSALAFAEQRTKNHTLVFDTGHIGLIASRNAPQKIWTAMADWFAAQQ
jgi:polyhydroxyalkanoate synthase